MRASQMTGTSWHPGFITKDEDDIKRNKKWCIHYSKHNKHCNVRYESCIGSSQCPDYKEKVDLYESIDKTQLVEEDNKTYTDKEGKEYFPIGCGVKHIKYGKGLVLEINKGIIVVEFIKRGRVEFGLSDAINNELLKRT